MNLPNFKGVLQKLSVLKHNSSLLIAVIIIVIAVILFIPTQLISSKLKGQIEDESLKKGTAIQAMNAFSREQSKEEEKYQQSYAHDANQIKLLAEQSSKRELLSYKIFPEPNDISALIFEEFGNRFRKGVEDLITGMKACDSPSDAELQRSLQNSSVHSRFGGRSSSIRSSASGSRYFRGSSLRIMNDIDATIVDEICLDKAKSGSVYANPADVAGYEFWKGYQNPGREDAIKDCWYWQLGYWVIKDVVDTIEAMNAGSNSVLASPVKRLMRIGFTLGDVKGMRFQGSRAGRRFAKTSSEGKPTYILSKQDGLAESCTGRLSTGDIDVIHFNVVVLVGADAVLPFMQEFCSAKEHQSRGWKGQLLPPQTHKHNQITILESNIRLIDAQNDQNHYLYRYGEDAVMELDLICEYIFNKTGYDEVKPETIKKELQGEEAKTPQ